MTSPVRSTILAFVAACSACATAHAQLIRDSDDIPEQRGVGLVDRTGESVPMDATFVGADGQPVELSTLFDGERPVLMVPVYFDCPVLCVQTLQRVLFAINEMDWIAGDDFRVVCYSFDHTEGVGTARAKQRATLDAYSKKWTDAQGTWAFLTSPDVETPKRVSTALGYHYTFMPRAGAYSHAAGVYFLTPDGVIHNFIEGLDFSGEDLEKGLREARDGEKRSIFEAAYLWCFPYNDETGSNTPSVMRLMTVGATGGALVLFGVIGTLLYTTGRRSERERARAAASSGAPTDTRSGPSV
ncbi:MAG: hypothetical protein AAGH64_05090 [Planctomycetota bacterium]